MVNCVLLLQFLVYPPDACWYFFQKVFEYFTQRTPRSNFEQRETSLVWNYKYAGRCLIYILNTNETVHVSNFHVPQMFSLGEIKRQICCSIWGHIHYQIKALLLFKAVDQLKFVLWESPRSALTFLIKM